MNPSLTSGETTEERSESQKRDLLTWPGAYLIRPGAKITAIAEAQPYQQNPTPLRGEPLAAPGTRRP